MADYTGGAKAGEAPESVREPPGYPAANDEARPLERGGPSGTSFELAGGRLMRRVRAGDARIESSIPVGEDDRTDASTDPLACWWDAYLAGQVPVSHSDRPRNLRLADLFCGAGGLTMGVTQFARDLSLDVVVGLAVDSDRDALATFSANHDVRVREATRVASLIDFRMTGRGRRAAFAYQPEIVNESAAWGCEDLDLLVAGPPCQGHSSLNNRSRWHDPRNTLMQSVAAFAAATRVPAVVIENVPGALRDQADVVLSVQTLLRSQGYRVTAGVLAADEMGWPQTRRRYFMVARLGEDPLPLEQVQVALADPDPQRGDRSVSRVLGHVHRHPGTAPAIHSPSRRDRDRGADDALSTPTAHSRENQARIDWLFENDAYDLPDSERPFCHRDGTTYGSVYGRMRPDAPAPTITTGFPSPGRGRFTHPTERRTITPREAALIQGFPSNYRFVTEVGGTPTRTQLAKWIGDAVPMPLGYAAALAALGNVSSTAPEESHQ